MVVQLGSMAIKGVFKAGALLSGLGSTSGKLKEVQQRSKSTTTEMKRMTAGANKLKGALAAIGVAGFSALLLTTPQLAGALAKIKYEMQRIAWAVGKHLKPALDAVATILKGIRTGDWSVVIQGVKDLALSVAGLVAKAGKYVIDFVFGEGTFEDLEKDFNNWLKNLKAAWGELDLKLIFKVVIEEPLKWLGDLQRSMLSGEHMAGKGERARSFLGGVHESALVLGELQRSSYQTGGYVPQTGMYKLHQGETVTMAGSSVMDGAGNGSNTITLDFSGANISLNGGVQLDQFADVVSNKIAERQRSLTY